MMLKNGIRVRTMKMNVSRKEFLKNIRFGAALVEFSGCVCGIRVPAGDARKAKIALQLYSIHKYIGGEKDKLGNVTIPGTGLDKALEDVAAIGFTGVEFAGYYQYEKDPKGLRVALANAGLKPCGTHVGNKMFGFDTKAWTYDPEVLKRTCDFNMSYGNNLIVCPGGGNFPPGVLAMARGEEPYRMSQDVDDFSKKLVEFYDRAATDAAKMGCRVGLHNHMWEHAVLLRDGTSFWDYFFANTSAYVCMEQDIGWTTGAGVDPLVQYEKYPHRSPTLHAKENGVGKNVKDYDSVLGQSGCDGSGRPCSTPVDWDGLIPVTERDGVEWYVVECSKHFEDFSAVLPSYSFLRSKGLGSC